MSTYCGGAPRRPTGTSVLLTWSIGVPDMQSWTSLVSVPAVNGVDAQPRSDVVSTPCVGEQTSSSVLHRLHLPQRVLRHTTQQRVAPVQAKAPSYAYYLLPVAFRVDSLYTVRGLTSACRWRRGVVVSGVRIIKYHTLQYVRIVKKINTPMIRVLLHRSAKMQRYIFFCVRPMCYIS